MCTLTGSGSDSTALIHNSGRRPTRSANSVLHSKNYGIDYRSHKGRRVSLSEKGTLDEMTLAVASQVVPYHTLENYPTSINK